MPLPGGEYANQRGCWLILSHDAKQETSFPGRHPSRCLKGRSPRPPRQPAPHPAAPLVWSLLEQHLLWGAHGRVPSLSLGCVFLIRLSLWMARALPCRPPPGTRGAVDKVLRQRGDQPPWHVGLRRVFRATWIHLHSKRSVVGSCQWREDVVSPGSGP